MSRATDGDGDHADVGLLSPATVGTVAESLTSDREVTAAMVAFETALRHALVHHELAPRGGFPRDLADLADVVDVRGLARDAVRPGNPTVPLVAALRARVDDADEDWVHHGATSQDVVDSALMLVATAVLRQVDDDLTRLASRLADLAVRNRDVVCVARTLTQQALPTTLGFRVAGWLAGVQDALVAVRAVRPLPVSLGGPVGTLASYGDAGPAVLDVVAAELGLAAPTMSWHTQRTPVLALGSALVAVGEACGRIAADVLLMAQTEVGEADDGSGGASSAMAHKSNPTRSVLVATAARQLPPLLAAVAASGAGASERPAGDWHAEWQPVRTMLRLAGAAAERTRDLAADLAFDRIALRRNLDLLVDALDADDAWVTTQTATTSTWVDRVVKRQESLR